jgi:hypothetical protein
VEVSSTWLLGDLLNVPAEHPTGDARETPLDENVRRSLEHLIQEVLESNGSGDQVGLPQIPLN